MTRHMTSAEAGQVNAQAARIYDEFFVPALFRQFAPDTVRAAGIGPGDHVLDLACGTGVVARAALQAALPGGRVVGVDVNPGMLAVAVGQSTDIEWIEAAAEALPFDDARFDAVLCQFGLMFFADRSAALAEARRILRPDGRLAVATFAPDPDSPGYRDLIPLIRKIAGDAAARALEAPFCLGDPEALHAMLSAAGFTDIRTRQIDGTARFASLDAWLRTEIGGWTLADMFTSDMLDDLIGRARTALSAYVGTDGKVAFAAPALITSARRPARP